MAIDANLGNLMKEAQKMQQRMQEAQKQLMDMTVTGAAGAGLVTVTMNGQHYASKVTVKQSVMEEDVEILQDLIAAAINDAVRKIESSSREKISQLTAGLNIPTDLFGEQSGSNE